MAILKHTFKTDTLFKMLFVKYPDLLKRLVAKLLGVQLEQIEQFHIVNSEMPPETLGDKFARLDINMVIDDQHVDLEIQVRDEGDYPERTLYYWAREYSSALIEGGAYKKLPRVVLISIINFPLFDSDNFHSEFLPLEATRNELLTDRMSLRYYELPKLPEAVTEDDELLQWLHLFKANTDEELRKIEAMGVPLMEQAINAYRTIAVSPEFKEIERQRSIARHNEASALLHATEVATEAERTKWQGVVAEQAAIIAELRSKLNPGE